MQRLEAVIRGTVRENLPETQIRDVSIRPDVDASGDPIVWVTVVFDAEAGKLIDPQKALTLIGAVRRKLEERNDKAFPVMSFVSSADLARLPPDAA